MKKAIKLAIAVAALTFSTNASANAWESDGFMFRMWSIWANLAEHRPCSKNIYRACDGQLLN